LSSSGFILTIVKLHVFENKEAKYLGVPMKSERE